MAKMKENSKAYNIEAANLALSLITIKPCLHCGHPVFYGNCCPHCKSNTPTHKNQEPSIVEI